MDSYNFNVWGPYAWYKFHSKAIRYPHNPCKCEIRRIINYYQRRFLKYIDCESCVEDYLKILRIKPIRPDTRWDLFIWTVDVHNIVNTKLGKKMFGYDEAYHYWTNVINQRSRNRYDDSWENKLQFNNNNIPIKYQTGIMNNYHPNIINGYSSGTINKYPLSMINGYSMDRYPMDRYPINPMNRYPTDLINEYPENPINKYPIVPYD